MDAWVLARLAAALEREWAGAWLQCAWQDEAQRLILKLRQRGRNGWLLLSCNPPAAGLGLVPHRTPCPARPPALAAYLRAHGGGVLRAVRAVPGQRIVELELGGPETACRLVLEAIPRAGRLLAVDADGVVRAAGAGGDAGRPYGLPVVPEGRSLPAAVQKPDLAAWLAAGEPLQARVLGLGAALAREVVHRAAGGDPWPAWQAVLAECGGPGPLWAYADQLSAARLTHRSETGTARHDELVAAGEFLLNEATQAAQCSHATQAAKAAATARQRLDRRLDKIRADLAALPEPLATRRQAEALAAVLWQVQPGQRTMVAPDLYASAQMHTIALDPARSPGANLDRLYHLARRQERTREALERRLAASEHEREQGPLLPPVPPIAPGRGVAPAAPYRRFFSSDGWPIWVGRNRVENDRLVRESRPWDVWLHVRDAGGAHVVIHKPGREARVPERTLTEAAGLAARYSSRCEEAAVDVQVTEVSRLRKPKGASPGQVLVADDRTLRVPPGAGTPLPA